MGIWARRDEGTTNPAGPPLLQYTIQAIRVGNLPACRRAWRDFFIDPVVQ